MPDALSDSTTHSPELWGCDFTSAPTARKPIVLAIARHVGGRIELQRLERLGTLDAWASRLAQPGHWVGGFDLPFGLPRELVLALGWPTEWLACMRHYAALDRATIRDTFAGFCQARPVGGKFAHRATDGPAGSSPSMKWVNPPVAFMLHAGVPRLIDAGATLVGVHAADPQRVALEAYPGLLAREVLGSRSYKSDDRAKQTSDRLIARKDLLHALETGATRGLRAMGLRVSMSATLRETLIADPQGDALDALLCAVQAAWGQWRHAQGDARYGLPPCDPLEGWIVTAERGVTPDAGTPGTPRAAPAAPRERPGRARRA